MHIEVAPQNVPYEPSYHVLSTALVLRIKVSEINVNILVTNGIIKNPRIPRLDLTIIFHKNALIT